jgi:hypothetical protein
MGLRRQNMQNVLQKEVKHAIQFFDGIQLNEKKNLYDGTHGL